MRDSLYSRSSKEWRFWNHEFCEWDLDLLVSDLNVGCSVWPLLHPGPSPSCDQGSMVGYNALVSILERGRPLGDCLGARVLLGFSKRLSCACKIMVYGT